MSKTLLNIIIAVLLIINSKAQTTDILGTISFNNKPFFGASISIKQSNYTTTSDSSGYYQIQNINAGDYTIQVSAIGYNTISQKITVKTLQKMVFNFTLTENKMQLTEVVVSGTLKEVNRSQSPVNVEVYSCNFFKKNPTPNVFDALQNINGVRPQLNCNICSTGDIHINGLEGPYTMILIDGMPIVSGLSSVYGLSGIPNALIDRIEIVKGPASSLYGSEAVGGLINIITKKIHSVPIITADFFTTSWAEKNIDLGFKLNTTKKISVLTGINYFNSQRKFDNNNDNFTDVTLQNRLSVFQKWNYSRTKNRIATIATRYMYENRWGGELNWNENYRNGDSIYGESIYTKRFELLGNYQLPLQEKLLCSFSYNSHNQNSAYGNTLYLALQRIAFAQLTWDKKIDRHDLLAGIAIRYTFYVDNTPATNTTGNKNILGNKPQKTYLPGIFLQDEITITNKQKLLLGMRYDYNNYHGNVFTPRIGYKYNINNTNILRFNIGTGFRVVNLFTEEHAALTGSRDVIVKNTLKPEQSYNANLNYIKKIHTSNNTLINIDATAFFTYFTNRIVGDYQLDPNKIIFDNINGYAISKGISINIDVQCNNELKISTGITLMENTITKNGFTEQQMLTEKFTGVWAISYSIKKINTNIDYTGNVYSPMKLPLLGPLDPRPEYSPWWSLQNIQLTFEGIKNINIYGGIKNLLNWTPAQSTPFLIARSNDPFDKQVQFDANGKALATANNPNALTFDPSYVYAPNQGLRFFIGLRYSITK